MQPLSRILLPIDFSERSAFAAICARSLALQTGASLLAVHALPPAECETGEPEVTGAMLASVYKARAQQAEMRMRQFVAAELAGTVAEGRVLVGEPAPVIVRLAREESAGLIVMPTHGYGQFRRFILGSNTAKVLHDCDCPVLTGVHLESPPSPPAERFQRVLCAVDLGAQSSKALCWAGLLAAAYGAHLSLLHVVSAPVGTGAGDPLLHAALSELEKLAGFVNVEAELFAEAGEPAEVACSAAARLRADALVIGRGSAAGIYGRLRANAYSIIRQSPCPVVSV